MHHSEIIYSPQEEAILQLKRLLLELPLERWNIRKTYAECRLQVDEDDAIVQKVGLLQSLGYSPFKTKNPLFMTRAGRTNIIFLRVPIGWIASST